MSALIIAEHNNRNLRSTTLMAISAANQLATDIVVLVVGYNCQSVAAQAAATQFVTKVLCIDHANYANLLAENITYIVAKIIPDSAKSNYKYIICAATSFGKNVLPRIAARLDVEQVSEVTKIISSEVFERLVYAGHAIQTVRLGCLIKCLTIRTIHFIEPLINKLVLAPIEYLNAAAITVHPNIKFLTSHITDQPSRPELTNAKIVVAGGSGLKTKENFALVEQLADQLHAAVGATKSVVDAGWAPNDWQIGQTGKTIAPNLYIAIGISGAIQHIAGIRESKVIVAINIDEHANIFKVANYAMVGDLFKILPELIANINCLTQKNQIE